MDIKASDIPNSGYGAYLTYLGARKLTPGAKARSARLIEAHDADEDETTEPLSATTIHGMTMDVTVKGLDLHSNDNSLYWTKVCHLFCC